MDNTKSYLLFFLLFITFNIFIGGCQKGDNKTAVIKDTITVKKDSLENVPSKEYMMQFDDQRQNYKVGMKWLNGKMSYKITLPPYYHSFFKKSRNGSCKFNLYDKDRYLIEEILIKQSEFVYHLDDKTYNHDGIIEMPYHVYKRIDDFSLASTFLYK